MRAREMMDGLSVVSQPWKKKADQERLINSLQRDLYVEKTVREMTTVEMFNQLRVANGE